MKNRFLGFFVGFFVAFLPLVSYGVKNARIQPMEFMSLEKVCQGWGEQALDAEKFKASGENRSVRAKMACSLLKNQKNYIGLDSQEIKKIFGDYSGYFFSESFPTYLINSAKKEDKNVWQILFFIGEQSKVSKIVVHKNCCYQ